MINLLQNIETTKWYLNIIRQGLKPAQHPKKVIVIGAGIAGLVTSSLLKKAGHQVTLIEARTRVGGRVFTMRSPFTSGLYMDMGAMRISENHKLTLEYIKKFSLPLNEFINGSDNDLLFVNGIKTRYKHYKRHPAILNFPVTPQEQQQTATELLQNALSPLLQQIETSQDSLDQLIKQFDSYSVMDYLRHNPFNVHLSQGALDMIEVLLDVEAFSTLSFLEIFNQYLMLICINPGVFYEIEGGNDRLPQCFLPELDASLLLNKRVVRIAMDGEKVFVSMTSTDGGETTTLACNDVVMTVPLPVLQFINITPRHLFSYEKWKVIQSVHYGAAMKIAIEFKERFWEKEGLEGGKAVSDLPIRFTYYPSHSIPGTKHGVILASYTWENDTLPWEGLDEKERIRLALDNLAQLHGHKIYDLFVTGASYSWLQDPWAAGGFSAYQPGNRLRFGKACTQPEQHIHFAGEHASSHPAWIEGAVESGIRTALEIHEKD
ncbi:putative L-amino-acid oxidase YobN [Pullulanibacillus camelliae]|uniref:Putative L-amino-acid oxidase YobN n=1 Tax=Pullulanibacillus camelliae TaxID=1707096 RepID=A0A8J2VSB2_9BACL|nr:flavin monoamine oxidase family protein [Pullulanibacillus camelliae]GGE37175.1 putative L-amino-acid oxidase YobN [Pullulanibacillus camelliae]